MDNFETDGSSPETESGSGAQQPKAIDETALNRTITARQRKLEEKLTLIYELSVKLHRIVDAMPDDEDRALYRCAAGQVEVWAASLVFLLTD